MHQYIASLQTSCSSFGNASKQAQLQDVFSGIISMLHNTCDAGITPLDDVIRLRQNRIGPMPYYLGAVLLSLRRRCPFRGHLELKIERYELKQDMQAASAQSCPCWFSVHRQLPPEHAVKQQHSTTLRHHCKVEYMNFGADHRLCASLAHTWFFHSCRRALGASVTCCPDLY